METLYVIKKPLLTEKSTVGVDTAEQYTFEVDRRATKTQIKRAVEDGYGVKVVSVRTMVRKGKERRLKYGYVTEAKTKKAIVRLRDGDVIELF